MSGPEDKGGGDKGGDKAKHDPPKKKGIWGVVGAVISVGVALIVLFALTGSGIPMVAQGAVTTVNAFGMGLNQLGIAFGLMGTAVSSFGTGVLTVVIRVIIFVVLIAFGIYFGMEILKKIRSGNGAGGHH